MAVTRTGIEQKDREGSSDEESTPARRRREEAAKRFASTEVDDDVVSVGAPASRKRGKNGSRDYSSSTVRL